MKLILDRISENQQGEKIAVFECDDKMLEISENNMPDDFFEKLTYGIIIEAQISDGKLINPVLLRDETESKMEHNRMRLNRLRNRNK